MKIGFIGLGRMGLNMVIRLMDHGHQVVGYARHEESRAQAKEKGAEVTTSLEGVVKQLDAPRVVWVMVPAGKATEDTIDELSNLLDKGDIIVIHRTLKGKEVFVLKYGKKKISKIFRK